MSTSRLLQRYGPSILLSALLFTASPLCAQEPKEATQELSKASRKGLIYDVRKEDDGTFHVTYMNKVEKKSDEVTYEDYVFDKDLNFKGSAPTKVVKELKPTRKMVGLAAYVGGTSSFSVLSMSLKVYREEYEQYWNFKRQRYERGKLLSREAVKLRNSEGKYKGFAEFYNEDEHSLFVVGSYDKGKKEDDQYVALYINSDLDVKETKVPVTGDYTLAYCGALENGNRFLVLAPNEGMPDTRKYTYVEFTHQAELVTQSEFTAPSTHLLIMSHGEQNGELYFCGVSTNNKKAGSYRDVFHPYAPIVNPGVKTGESHMQMYYNTEVYYKDFDNFHFLKLQKGQLAFATTTSIKDMEKRVTTPPSQRKAHPYKGRKMVIQQLQVAPNGNILIAGQLEAKKATKDEMILKYMDLVGFMFTPQGELITQFAVEKMNNDSDHELFPSEQYFRFSPDGKTAYWQIYEVRSRNAGNIFNVLSNTVFLKRTLFPRVARIDLEKGTLGDFTVLGSKGKFFIDDHDSGTKVYEQNIYYFGHDKDDETLWVAKFPLQ
jgi:hypothetical protein